MLFDTPLLDTPKTTASGHKEEAGLGNKRRRSSVDGGAAKSSVPVGSFDVDKLLQKMQQQPSPSAKSGKASAAAEVGGKTAMSKQQQENGPAPKRQKAAGKPPTKVAAPGEEKAQASAPTTPAGEGKRAKKAKNKEKKAAAAAVVASGDRAPAVSTTEPQTAPIASTSRVSAHEAPHGRHAAPSLKVVGSTLTGSTKKGSVQDKLRAQLAGGKFRMLNEQLYTTSGDDAHRLMKEDGAFDDVSLCLCLSLPTFCRCSLATR